MRKTTELDMHGPSAVVGSKGGKKLKDAKANKSLAKAEERKSKRLQREMAVCFPSNMLSLLILHMLAL